MSISLRRSTLTFAGLLASVLLSGCGGSSSKTIPATTTVFYAHTAVLGHYSTVLATGYNAFGQLGNGNKDTASTLVPVVGLTGVGGVAVGADHTVAFANHSSVYAWGSNYHSQIGNAKDTSGVNAYSSVPVKVQPPLQNPADAASPKTWGGDVSAVAAGEFHNLVIAGTRSVVYAWGYNAYGQLGDGNFTDSAVPVPVQAVDSAQAGILVGLDNIDKIVAGGLHSLALSKEGRVYAWGYNVYGQLGRDPNTPLHAYENIADLVSYQGAPLENVTAIAAGGGTSYALKKDVDSQGNPIQLLLGWGYNGVGQLGPIVDPAAPYALTPVVIATFPANTVKDIAAGLDHLLVLYNDGSVWGIGFNRFAQLGNFSTIDSSSLVQVLLQLANPPKVPANVPMANAIEIKAFGNSSMAKVFDPAHPEVPPVWYGWGDNGYGELGNEISTSSIGYLQQPAVVRGF